MQGGEYIVKGKKKFFFIFGGTIILFFIIARFYPVKIYEENIKGYAPIIDDTLAQEFSPIIYSENKYDNPYRILYRASIDENNNIYLAYHIFWKNEVNSNDGFMPMLNRLFYTGGLKLQKTMFGKEDIEVIEVMINSEREVVRIQYETAENYNPKDFSVEHKSIKIEEDHISAGKKIKDIGFNVISWNHLFEAVRTSDMDLLHKYNKFNIIPEYFSNKEWKEYGMFKKINTMLKKNRAHFEYERETVN